MKQIVFTVLILALVAISNNAMSYAIVGANCPHFNMSQNCLEPANGETWIRIKVNFPPNSNIENTNWSIDFSVSDPSQYEKIHKNEFVNYGGGEYLLRNMYRFPIPTDAQSYVFALFLKAENNGLLVTEEFPFNICGGNNPYRLENPFSNNLPGTKNYLDGNFKLDSNLNQTVLDDFKVYPNPIISDFTIEYQTNQNEEITLQIFDIKGRSIYKTQFNHQYSGQYQKYFDNLNLSKGVYFCNIQTVSFHKTLKLTKL